MLSLLKRSMRSTTHLVSSNFPRAFSTTNASHIAIHFKNHDDFVKKVFVESDMPVIVDFHAGWCEACNTTTYQLKKDIEPLDDMALAVVDVEEHIDLVKTFGVKAVPAILEVKDGLVVGKYIGLVGADIITRIIKQKEMQEEKLNQDVKS